MPKKTFENLSAEKKELFINAFLREFAIKSFDDASISGVVKELGIAKGSVYQYFNDKLDLYLYLIGHCSNVKMKYVTIQRKDHKDFWTYFRMLYVQGYQFDKENHLESHFLHNLPTNLNSKSIKELYQSLLKQVVEGFEQMVKYEIEMGLFRNDLPIETMSFMLYKLGEAIREHLEYNKTIIPSESISKNTPVYQDKKDLLLQVVDNYIGLIRPSFDIKQ